MIRNTSTIHCEFRGTPITYSDAETYASTQSGRLPTKDELLQQIRKNNHMPLSDQASDWVPVRNPMVRADQKDWI